VKIRGDPEKIGVLGAALIRVIGWTLRIKVEDRARAMDPDFKQPMIWTFWHNRMFVVPLVWIWHAPHRKGAALTSGSKDGAMVAGIMKAFGSNAIRGSTSRRGAAALRELTEILEQGDDVAIAPDGPRGPRYKAGAGVVFLARQTGAAILPVRVEYSRALRLKSWDRFMIPLPFSKVRVVFEELMFIGAEMEAEEAEAALEKVLGVDEE